MLPVVPWITVRGRRPSSLFFSSQLSNGGRAGLMPGLQLASDRKAPSILPTFLTLKSTRPALGRLAASITVACGRLHQSTQWK